MPKQDGAEVVVNLVHRKCVKEATEDWNIKDDGRELKAEDGESVIVISDTDPRFCAWCGDASTV